MEIVYSASNNSFFAKNDVAKYQDAGWEISDAVDVSYNIYLEYIQDKTSEGKVRIAGKDGLPSWGDAPIPEEKDIQAMLYVKRQSLINEATIVISPMKDALDGGYIEESDKKILESWQRYRYALTKVDLNNPIWPQKP
ncbi:tail fiber assembly protein [Escherichia coli]|uniref:tail fiber assembly protein n=1 Tax=Escherichia coli TaxID=562 RepID=UPI000C34C340|nr:tail fiber assembly protein [Escherichia coli]EFK8585630.1 tail fiber assembly protein [Escherichia coli]EFK8660614.1 tail fiber assembly protein [Escherichia coli]MDM1640456.1 tail fiber assembly protein [Escherichia coli]PKE88716.1 tail fiber assembly protein [Escherichia coli]PLB76256.1 tail fiber assembly protein [Escherichia coli]